MSARVIGMLEAFELIEEVGRDALTFDELLFAADARRRCGCRSMPSRMAPEDRKQMVTLGQKCWQWKEAHR